MLYPIPLRHTTYPRPAVIIDEKNFDLLAISTKPYEKFNSFTIPDYHPDFPATGLKATSYVIGAPVFSGDRSLALKPIGEISGELAEEFAKWI